MLTANCKSLTAKYKSLTANSNRPQQIQIDHSQFKSLTANSNLSQQIKVADKQIQGSAFLSMSRVESIFSSVEGTLSRVPILQRGNLIIKLS